MSAMPNPPRKGLGTRFVDFLACLPASAALIIRISTTGVLAMFFGCLSLVAIIGLVRVTNWLVHLILGGR